MGVLKGCLEDPVGDRFEVAFVNASELSPDVAADAGVTICRQVQDALAAARAIRRRSNGQPSPSPPGHG